MPTRRGAAASATPGTLTGQISMSDVLLQALGDEASMDAAQFSQRVGDLFKEQPAQGRGEGAPLSRQGSLGGGRSSGRSARITASNVSGDTSNSGKTAQEIWHDIVSKPPAEGDGPGWKRQQSATQGQAALGALASGLSGLGTLLQGGATLGSGAFPGGSLISQASLDKLVAEHPAKTTSTKEWVDLLVNSANPAPLRGIAGSQKVALENAALDVMAVTPRGTRSKDKGPVSPRKAGSAATAATAPAAKETKKRGRVAIESDRPIVNLPPKKKGRRRKGEVDTETEEEKRLRAEERQRKNRESAARSHRRKAQHAEELEKRARDQEKKISDLEKENAKLRRQLSEAKEKLKKSGLGLPGGSLKRTSSARS